MTVPLLTQALAEPAKMQPASKRDAANQPASDDPSNSDFAKMMDSQPTKAPEDKPGSHATAGDNASHGTAGKGEDLKEKTGEKVQSSGVSDDGTTTELNMSDVATSEDDHALRKNVIIPELPTGTHHPVGQDGVDKTPSPTGTGATTSMLADDGISLAAATPVTRGSSDVTQASTNPQSVANQPDVHTNVAAQMTSLTQATKKEGTSVALSGDGASLTKAGTTEAMKEQGQPEGSARRDESAALPPRPLNLTAKSAQEAGPQQKMVAAKNQDIVENRAAVKEARDISARRYDVAPALGTQTVQASQAIPMATQMAILQPLLQQLTVEKQSSPLHGDAEIDPLQSDLRASSTSTTQQSSPTLPAMRADLPRNIAAQISEVVRGKPDKPVDVSLNPQELGRVRLSVSTGEGGVILNILAERPETLELMRRHADILARELSQLGFGSINLAFGEGRDASGSQADSSESGLSQSRHLNLAVSETSEDMQQTQNPRLTHQSGGLDIRV